MSSGPKPNCPWRKEKKHRLDRANTIANIVIGGLFGMLIALPFLFQILVAATGTDISWVFPVATLLILAALFALPALFFGDRYVNWLSENWTQFIRHRHGGG